MKEGNVVLYEGALAGYVDSVSSDKSLVKSAFSPLNEINGVLTDAKIPILLFGKGAGLYSSRVPKDTKTEIGSVVVTDYSNDYIIGEIVQVRENEQDPFKELLIISPFNPIVVNTVKIKIE